MQTDIKNRMDMVIKDFIDKTDATGVAVGIVEKGEIVYTKALGVMNVETKEPVTEKTLFHMASVSKPFVATAIMQLVEKGKINLDTPLIEYVPYFKINGEGYKNITIRQMLSHISGMPDVDDYEWDKPQYDNEAAERYIRNLDKYELNLETPGKFDYSNLAFDILGHVISKVSGETFENYIKKNILEPLEMNKSSFLNKEVDKTLLATPHVLSLKNRYDVAVSKVFPYNRRHAPSSTLCSNVLEMCNWAIANLNKGVFKNKQILKADTHLEMFKSAAETGWGSYNNEVGFSWFLGDYKGNRVISHGGCDTGFLSKFLLVPERELGIVFITNCDYVDIEGLATALLDLCIGNEAEGIKAILANAITKVMINKGIDAAKNEYNFIKKNNMDKYCNTEYDFNNFAYLLCGDDKVNEAIEMLKIGIAEFPKAANLYDSLGEMYLKNDNKEMAIVNYKKSLELNPDNKIAEKILKEIMK